MAMRRLLSIFVMCILFAGMARATEYTVTIVQSDMGVISVSYDDNGSFKTTTESFTVAEGTDIFVKVQSNDRKYALEKVLCNGEKLETSSSYWVMSDIELEAVFVERKMCNVTLKPYSNGTVTVSYIDPYDMGFYDWNEGEQIYSHSVMMITATPEQDYMLEGIFIDGEKMTSSSFTIYDDIEIEVKFKSIGTVFDYRLENNYDPGLGDVTVIDSDGNLYETDDKVLEGTKLTITVTPKENCIVKSFELNGEDKTESVVKNGSVSVRVTKDIYIDTVFESKGAVEDTDSDSGMVIEDGRILFDGNVSACIYDYSGRRVYAAENVDECSVSSLAPGAYILAVKSGNSVKTIKFVKH